MNSRVFLIMLLPMALTAQVMQDVAPLKNWPAPLYWQPSNAEAAGKSLRNSSDLSRQTGASANALTLPLGGNALVFVALTPCRVVDTRTGQGFSGSFGPPSLAGGASRTFPVHMGSPCPIPSFAQAYSFNVTVIPPGFLGFVTVYPTGATRPNASTLNDSAGLVLANAAIVAAGTGGSVDVYANNATDLIIDINGYYAPPTDQNGNTALGFNAFSGNTTGADNTATGMDALYGNTTGSGNTATGSAALYFNTGNYNNANGYFALGFNAGNFNTALGAFAMQGDSARDSGNQNLAIGYKAGVNLTTGSNNIIIGSHPGSAGLTNTIIIGDGVNQQHFLVSGVRNVTTDRTDGLFVLIDGNGQLGTMNSSRRYKEDINDMGDASSKLLMLRPVTYRYKKPDEDASKPIDYGLIAEEVEEIYPDLVVRNKDGQIETVQYQKLTPMLLNEVQKQSREIEALKAKLAAMSELEARLAALEAMLSKVATSSQQP